MIAALCRMIAMVVVKHAVVEVEVEVEGEAEVEADELN